MENQMEKGWKLRCWGAVGKEQNLRRIMEDLLHEKA